MPLAKTTYTCKEAPKDERTPRMLDRRALLQAYEWNPAVSSTHFRRSQSANVGRPENATMQQNKYFERSKTNRRVIILESEIDVNN